MGEVVIFNHIPKTAGTTLKYVLCRIYGSDAVMTSQRRGEHRGRLVEASALIGSGKGRVLIAHTGYGVQEYLPGDRRYRLFTVLRDPVARAGSRYRMAQREEGYEGTVEDFFVDYPLEHNAQTGFLGGLWLRRAMDERDPSPEDYGEELLARASDAMRRHEVVGIAERFDETLLQLGSAFSWPLHKMVYVSANKGAGLGLTEAEQDVIRAHNALDERLYEEAAARFVGGSTASLKALNLCFRGARRIARRP